MNLLTCYTLINTFTYIYSETMKKSDSTLETSTVKVTTKDSSADLKPNLNSLWLYRPTSHVLQESAELEPYRFELRTPRLVTKLAKTYSLGFDPYFSKSYFEPFEKRQKPVTLVAFRKNGLVPKRTIKFLEDKSFEIAELQSPYNYISSFWIDHPGESES